MEIFLQVQEMFGHLEPKQERIEASKEDLLLVNKIQAGYSWAFKQLMLRYREKVYLILYNILSNKEDAADLSQEVWLKIYRKVKDFKGKSSFFTWLYRITTNEALSFLRKNRWKRFFSLEKFTEEAGAHFLIESLYHQQSKTVSKEVFLKEVQQKINEALQSLTDKHRVVVVLVEIEGLSLEEAAKILKCSMGTVKSRLHYAKQLLKNKLKDYL